MDFVSGKTSEEKRLITTMQSDSGCLPDNSIGPDTIVGWAQTISPEVFPVSVEMYSQPVVVGKDILPFDPGGGLSGYSYSLSGSFTYPSGVTPCSIMVNDGKTICGSGSHAWLGFKESVIYQKKDGTIGICRAAYDTEIPDRQNVKWAIGGMGLLGNYNPKLEGFSKFSVGGKSYDYSDVLRRTNHTVLGVKNGYLYGAYVKNMTALEINSLCRDRFKFEMAILLDGGHIAAINSPDFKINTGQSQGYGIQFIGGAK